MTLPYPQLLFIGEIKPPLAFVLTLEVILLFFAILFLQSGWDKISDRAGNLSWLQGHFANSPLGSMVPVLLTILTITEMLAGILSLVAALLMPFTDIAYSLPFYAILLCTVNLLMLFFGQRMAKDYAGAAGIVPYFLVALAGLVLTQNMTY